MRHNGSVSDFTIQRNRELLATYNRLVARAKTIDIKAIGCQLCDAPASRFWISEERAIVVLSAMSKGIPLPPSTRGTKREMYEEMFSRLKMIRRFNPHLSFREAVSVVIFSPAPKFYLRPRAALEIIYKIRNGFYDAEKYTRYSRRE